MEKYNILKKGLKIKNGVVFSKRLSSVFDKTIYDFIWNIYYKF